MPLYQYLAHDANGDEHHGECEAADRQSLADELRGRGLRLIEHHLAEPGVLGAAAPPLTPSQAAELEREIRGLAASGLRLEEGLRAMASDMPAGATRRSVEALAARLDQGVPLKVALEDMGSRFPDTLGQLLEVGVESGRVQEVLEDFQELSLVGQDLRRTFWVSLIYPAVLLLMFGLIYWAFFMFVVKRFTAIFADFGLDLPIMTYLLVQASDLVTAGGYRIILVPLLVLFLLWISARLFLDAAGRRRIRDAIPLYGPLGRWISLSEFTRSLALLVECEIPLNRAVPLAARNTRDPRLEIQSREVARQVEQGATLAEASRAGGFFPAAFTRIVEWGEQHLALAETLHMAGDILESHARAQARFASWLTLILTLLIVFWGIGFAVIALFLPLVQLVSALSG